MARRRLAGRVRPARLGRADSPLRPGQPGNDFKPELFGEPDLRRHEDRHSAFYGEPDLHGWLQAGNIDSVVICGITTNHCCETTARMAGNLGYDTWFVRDATAHVRPRRLAADELARVTGVNLDGEFATVVGTSEMLEHVSVGRRSRVRTCTSPARMNWISGTMHAREVESRKRTASAMSSGAIISSFGT